MDGHEMIEVSYKKLEDIIDYRIEAEYFSKKFIKNEQLLSRIRCKKFNTIANAVNGRAYSSEAFSQDGDLYISKIGDVTNKRGVENWDKLSLQEFENKKGEFLTEGDILMTLTGDPPDVGKVNLISIEEKECTWNQRVAKITTLTDDYCSNYALYAVLSSELCRVQMERFAKGIRQRNLGNDCFSFVNIPIVSDKLQKLLDLGISKHMHLLQEAKTIYLNAEAELESYIKLDIYGNNNQPIAIKNFKESFAKTDRFDAEYYLPKYDKLFDLLNKVKTKSLGGENGITIIRKSIEPGSDAYSDEGIPYIRVSDITKYGITLPEKNLSLDTVENLEELYLKKDTILLSKDGSVGIAYKVDADLQMVTSGALLHLVVKDTNDVLPDYLTLVLNSYIVQLQAERDTNGAIIQHWKPSEIEKVLIPILDMSIQKKLAEKVQKSFQLRKNAQNLLDIAVKAVEIAVEQNEAVAIEWLKKKGVE